MNSKTGKDSKEVPFGPIGYITYKRTYARRINEEDVNSRTEEFHETIERELDGIRNQLKVGFTSEEEDYYRYMNMNLKASLAGRFTWQLGTKTVDKLGLPSLQNCSGCVVNHPIDPFVWAFDMLMLGSGVGYNIQKKYVYMLPEVKDVIKIERKDSSDADYIIPDTREGWVKLLGRVLKAHFYSGEGFTYSMQLIRSKGAVIKGFGGTASGPEELYYGINEIHKLLNNKSGQKLEPIDCLDIMNIIGQIVVSASVRRGAQIAIGDCDDIKFLKAKRWDLGNIPNWRAYSNNSVACDDINDLPDEYWETYRQGEAYGLINFKLAREVGRLGEYQYKDKGIIVFNPCGEQGLYDRETCCLADVYLCNIKNKEELFRVVTLLYKVCKHSLTLKCHLKDTEKIVNANMRIGISMSGILECTEEQLGWLDDCYKYLRKFDIQYSKEKGFPVSIKLTTEKPSGTKALIPGILPGVHPSPAGPHYIRRIRISANSPLVAIIKEHGYKVEYQKNFDGSEDHTTIVAEFPCKIKEGVPVAGNITAIEHLEIVKRLQTIWSDNSVSASIYYTLTELDQIKQWLRDNYKDSVKTISFMLYSNHGFVQAPYETITKEQYEEMISKTTPITSINSIDESSVTGIDECQSGVCPIK